MAIISDNIIKILKNITQNPLTFYGVKITPNGEYEIPSNEINGFLNDPRLEPAIIDGSIVVNNGTSDLSIADGWAWLNTFYIDTDTIGGSSRGYIHFMFGKAGTISSGTYLRGPGDTVLDATIGFVSPYNGKIVAMSGGFEEVDYVKMIVKKNGIDTAAQLYIQREDDDVKEYITGFDINFVAGDCLSVYCKSGWCKRPIVSVFCLWNEGE